MFEARRRFVVMNGSDKSLMNGIIKIVEMITGQMYGRNTIKCRTLERDQNAMMLISVRTSKKHFDEVKRVLSEAFPDQCLFDVEL